MKKDKSRNILLPTILRIAGERLNIRYSRATPPALPKLSTLLRRTNDRGGRLASRYWQTSSKGHYRLDWLDAGVFDLDAKRGKVTCVLNPDVSPGAVEEVLRGPVCAFFLLERGFEPLHASAVALDGRCVAFAGAPGAGKSSLVAWLSRNGAKFLCDDILPLRQNCGIVWGHPGLPQLRLEPPAARKLGWRGREEAGSSSSQLREKSKFPVTPHGEPKRVARIYLLERIPSRKGRQRSNKSRGGNIQDRRVQIQRLGPRQAFRALLKSTRNDSLDTPARLRRQMNLFAHIARTVPVCRLRYPHDYGALPAVLEAIQQDLKLC